MKRRHLIILGLLMAAVMLPVVAFAADDSSEEAGAQGEVRVDGAYMDSGRHDVTNNSKLEGIIDEINRNSEVKREISGPKEKQKEVGDPVSLKMFSTAADYKNYTYKITPLLPPFNNYYFVETGNPNPKSFRFADKASKYSDSATIAWDWDDWDNKVKLYADVKYDNSATARVSGGYIFYSGSTDGGQLVLQVTDNPDDWSPDWKDTAVKSTIPSAVDETDYLINTYAKKDSFFDNMDAVQDGFSSICLYSGSYVRGTLTKPNKYWYASIAGHIDQSFYIFSPYSREDDKSLFASAIYPFRYDSLGFPGMMASVAERLNSGATYKWNSNAHYLIDVTYGGETRSYGGQGNGEGQGVTGDKILQQFKFGAGGTKITLTDMHALLKNYAALKIKDDIPREDELTWKQIYNTVGSSGSWTRIAGGFWDTGDRWNCGEPRYAFFYQNGEGTSFDGDEWGIGYSLYWGGDLGYARDVWVDGRYVGEWRAFVPGETFSDHPTSGIILRNVTIPQITYSYDYKRDPSTSQYKIIYRDINIREETNTALFSYQDGKWVASGRVFDDGCALYDRIAEFVEQGLIDEKYLDMVTITQDEIGELNIDANTNVVPDKGYIFDGTDAPGTVFDESLGHCWYPGEITEEPTCTTAGKASIVCQVCGEAKAETVPAKGHSKPMEHIAANPATCVDSGNIEYWHCWQCGKYFADKDGKRELDEDSLYFWDGNHNWKHIKKPAGFLKNGSEYDQCTYCKEQKNVKKLTGYATYYVKGFKLVSAKKAFTAKWKKQSLKNQKKFSGYQIRYATKSSMKGAKYKTAGKKSSSKKITKLKKKTRYYVQVRTYTISKNVKYYSKWSKKKTIKTK